MPDNSPFSSRRNRSRNDQPVRRHAEANDSSQVFRRSRTLTGSASSSVRSASERKGQLLSSRLKVQSLRKHRYALGFATLASWMLVIAGGYLLNQYAGSLTVSTPGVVTDNQLTARVASSVDEYFGSRPFDRFRFAYNQAELSAYVAQQIPEVASVTLTKEGNFASARVETELREPVAKWQLGETLYYVDKLGVAFEENHFAEPSVSVEDRSGLPPTEQRQLASTAFLAFTGQIIAQLNRSENVPPVKSVVVPPNTLKQIELVVEQGQGDMRVKLNTDRPPQPQAEDVISTLQYMGSEGIEAEVVDVRIAGKAYYR